VALASWYLAISATGHRFAVDFVNTFWPAGHSVLEGKSPFPAFVYPPFASLFVAPFSLLPVNVAAGLFTALLVASAILALYVAGVRDWPCYFTIFLWWPVLSALQTANLTLLIALGVALVWRYRDRASLACWALGVILALKLFAWPLVIWLLATRRYAAAIHSVLVGIVVTVTSWAVLGFGPLTDYGPKLRLLAKRSEQESYTPLGASIKLGLGLDNAEIVGLIVGLISLVALVVLATWRRDDKRSFVLALVACILCSPIVWLHYFALLIVALAVLRPRYSPLWALPFFALGPAHPDKPTWWVLSVLIVLFATLAIAMVGDRPKERPPLRRSLLKPLVRVGGLGQS
jgi:hypothetical protein